MKHSFHHLLQAHLNRENLSPDQAQALQTHLKDPAKLDQFIRTSELESAIAATKAQQHQIRPHSSSPTPIRRLTTISAIAAALILALISIHSLQRHDQFQPQRYSQLTAPHSPSHPAKPHTIAQITQQTNAIWANNQQPATLIDNKNLAQLQLQSGFVEIRYANGAQIILEGPADYQVTSPNSGKLASGRASASITPAAAGFTINYPGGELVDIGTEFGVAQTGDQPSEAAVFKGQVALGTDHHGQLSLQQGQAVYIDPNNPNQELEIVPADPSRFVRSMPSDQLSWQLQSPDPSALSYNLSPHITQAGDYLITFHHQSGEHATLIDKVQLRYQGQIISQDNHLGTIAPLGNQQDNHYHLPLSSDQYQAGNWSLRARMRPQNPAQIPANSSQAQASGSLTITPNANLQAQASDYIGSWQYQNNQNPPQTIQRRIDPDGSAWIQYDQRQNRPPLQIGNWSIQDGILTIQSPQSSLREQHALTHDNQLIFLSLPYQPAQKVTNTQSARPQGPQSISQPAPQSISQPAPQSVSQPAPQTQPQPSTPSR